ncbi:hypothetical protein ACHQM5_023592 [Ranunculus cassubicifolius]
MSSSSSSNSVCFGCGDFGHCKGSCPWMELDCWKCQKSKMAVWITKNGINKGRSFINCRRQPACQNFNWVDELPKLGKETTLDLLPKLGKETTLDLLPKLGKETTLEGLPKLGKKTTLKMTIAGKKEITFEGDVDSLCEIIKYSALNMVDIFK